MTTDGYKARLRLIFSESVPKDYNFCSECGMKVLDKEEGIVHVGTSIYTDKYLADRITAVGLCSDNCMLSKYGTDMSPGREINYHYGELGDE